MLSKTERDYLTGKIQPSNNHIRYLRYKIKKKLKEFYQLELPLIQNSSVSDFTNVVSEFTNTLNNNSNKETISEAKQSLGWAPTPRPNAYEAFALPG